MLSVSCFRLITTTMGNKQGLQEDADIESQAHENDQSQVDLFTSGGRRGTIRRVFGREEISFDEDDQGDIESYYSSRRSEGMSKALL